MYKVSVIVPIYNTEKYLNKCLDSLVNQTLKDIEIILINDGSTDNSQNIIDEYSAKYSDKIKSFTKENGGQASARNFGITKATGQYIGFVDSDDWIELNMYEELYNKAIKEDLDIVCCNEYLVINNKKKKNFNRLIYPDNVSNNYILEESGPCNKLIKRDLFINNNIRFLENRIYEDLAVIPTLALYTNKIGYIDSYLYNYFIREGSTMNQTKYNKKLEDIFAVMNELSNKFKDKFKNELEFLYIKHLLHDASLRFLSYKEGKKQLKIISNIIKEKFPNWKSNMYFKQESFKYRLLCKLLYNNNPLIISIYLKLREKKGNLIN